jgi:hypothetical protein
MRLIDLPRTGSFRLALLFLALFGAASAVLFGFLFLQTHQFIIANVDGWLDREAPETFPSPLPDIESRFAAHAASNRGSEHVFALYGAEGRLLKAASWRAIRCRYRPLSRCSIDPSTSRFGQATTTIAIAASLTGFRAAKSF